MGRKFERLVMGTIIAVVTMLGVSSFATDDAYAHHLSDDLKWQLVFITSQGACGNYEIQSVNKYSEISEKYLELYQVENTKYEPLCYTEQNYVDEYLMPLDLDLILLVYDQDIGRKELHSQNIGGFYHHFGIDKARNHVIVMCDCPTYNYSSPVWILTHELSHFILYYLGYDESVIEDFVHSNDEMYDQCIESYNSSCESVVKHLRPETTSYQYSVMPIFEPAVGTEISSFDNNNVPAETIELSKMITTWWTTGKISEDDYANALGLIVDREIMEGELDSELLFADKAFDDSVTWADASFEKTEVNTDEIFRLIPTNMKPKQITEDGEQLASSQIPDWFKETGVAWVDGKIANNDFVDIVNYFYTERIISPPERTTPIESVSDEFKIDFDTQQKYFVEVQNEMTLIENERDTENQQRFQLLEELLDTHQIALKHFYHGNYVEASNYYDKVLELDPENVRALYNKGVSLARQNLFMESIEYFNKVVEIEAAEKNNSIEIESTNGVVEVESDNETVESEPPKQIVDTKPIQKSEGNHFQIDL